MKKIQKAFSLTELSIVILIIGVLVASIVGAKSILSKTKQLSSEWRVQGGVDGIPEILLSEKVEMWFDSSNINGNFNLGIRDNSKIKKWQDLSGNGYDAIQNNSNYQPIYQRDYGLKFDGINDYFPIAKKYYQTTDLNNVHIFTVFKSSSTNTQFLFSYDRSQYFRLSLKDSTTMGIALDTYSNGAIHDFYKRDFNDGQTHILWGFYEAYRSPYNKGLYVDGKLIGGANAHNNKGLGIGKRYGFIGVGSEAGGFDSGLNAGTYFGGNMFELIMIENSISNQEAIEITNYLSRKWKLASSVDSDNDGTVDNQDKYPTDASKF